MVVFPFWPGKNQAETKKESKTADGDQHRREREQFQEVLSSFSASRIEDRLRILDIFLSVEAHLSLTGLAAIIREKHPDLLDLGFLADTMEMFCRFGFAQKWSFDDREAVYEHRHLGMHHDHFICTRCGVIEEFTSSEMEGLQRAIARQFRFHPLQHKMEIYGLCAGCMARRQPALPLFQAANDEQVRIIRIEGDREIQGRLSDMGLSPGVLLEIVSNNASGPVIVAVRGGRLAINADLARRIMVSHCCRHDEETA